MSDDAKSIKAGDHLGEINGVPVKAKLDAAGKVVADVPAPPPAAAELALPDWHRSFVARQTVTLVKPRRVVRGLVFPEQRNEVALPSARAAVAMRTLHAMSPAELGKLRAAFEASADGEAHPDHFEAFALRHIEQQLPEAVTGVALQRTLSAHGHREALEGHKAKALGALAQA